MNTPCSNMFIWCYSSIINSMDSLAQEGISAAFSISANELWEWVAASWTCNIWRLMCVKISLGKLTDGFPVFWLLSWILIADCFVILSVLPFWGRSQFAYVASFLMCSHFECVLILSMFSFWMCSHFEYVLILNAFSFWMHSHFECILILNVFSFWMRSHFECVLIFSSFSFWVCSHFECVLILRAFSFWVCSHFDSFPKPCALTRPHSSLFEQENKMEQVSSQGVLKEIRRAMTWVMWQLRSLNVSEETIDFLVYRLEQPSRHLLRIMQTVNMGMSEQILLEDMTRCISLLSNSSNCILQPAP